MVDTPPNTSQTPPNQSSGNPNDVAGTSHQKLNPAQQNNTMLNPDNEANQAPRTAPGVTPSVKPGPETSPARPILDEARAGNEPEAKADNRAPERKRYKLKVGKHRYQDEDGNMVVADSKDPSRNTALLTRTEFEMLQDRFELPRSE